MGMKKPYIQLVKANSHETDIPENAGNLMNSAIYNDKSGFTGMFDIHNLCHIISAVRSLVFERCGAYAVTEGMALFLSRELPQVLLIDLDGNIRILRKKTEINILNSKMEENSPPLICQSFPRVMRQN